MPRRASATHNAIDHQPNPNPKKRRRQAVGCARSARLLFLPSCPSDATVVRRAIYLICGLNGSKALGVSFERRKTAEKVAGNGSRGLYLLFPLQGLGALIFRILAVGEASDPLAGFNKRRGRIRVPSTAIHQIHLTDLYISHTHTTSKNTHRLPQRRTSKAANGSGEEGCLAR